MPSRISNVVLVVLLGLVGASTNGCGARQVLGTPSGGAGSTGSAAGTGGAGTAGAAGASGAAGTGDSAGSRGVAGTGSAGVGGAAGAGTSGAAATGAAGTGVAGSTGAAGTTGVAGASGAAGAWALSPLVGDLSKIVGTPGCGQPTGRQLGAFVPGTIQTMGEKPAGCADSKCGPWSFAREYFVRLPPTYDSSKAYPIVFEGPGCGGKGINLFINIPLGNMAIRVGLSPSVDAQAFHATNPNQGCFDDHDGDDSVDWVFYENLYDRLAGELCFDRNRVFAAGNSTGARMANELGCKYAGDSLRSVRGVMTGAAGLPTDPKFRPTCTSKPMAGVWVHQLQNPTNPFSEATAALARAMSVSGCTIGNSYETAEFDPFPISPGDNYSCKRVKGCPASAPLVICPLPLNSHSSNENIVNPAWLAFVNLFAPAP